MILVLAEGPLEGSKLTSYVENMKRVDIIGIEARAPFLGEQIQAIRGLEVPVDV